LPLDPNRYRDVSGMVVGGFRQPVVTLAYIVAMTFLALHLYHGATSWFQSLGLNGRGYDKVINWVGPVLALIVLIGNCSIPLAILAGYVPK
jgi:succinate dehydrogenase / fumarate reductase cytochrome b subunit